MSKKPWLTYGLGDGLDVVHEEHPPEPKKFIWVILCFLFFGSIGGHRFYIGDKKGGVRWLFGSIVLQFLHAVIFTFSEIDENKELFVLSLIILVLMLTIVVKELLSLKGRVARYNVGLRQKIRVQ